LPKGLPLSAHGGYKKPKPTKPPPLWKKRLWHWGECLDRPTITLPARKFFSVFPFYWLNSFFCSLQSYFFLFPFKVDKKKKSKKRNYPNFGKPKNEKNKVLEIL
jgi:hypothetical protein